jgi:hypothetical protein
MKRVRKLSYKEYYLAERKYPPEFPGTPLFSARQSIDDVFSAITQSY